MNRQMTTWDDKLLANPHAVADKRKRVQRMFAAIAPSYDINNRLHSLWQDQRWRRKAVKLAGLKPNDVVVDVACGTGDLTLAFYNDLMMLLIQRDRKLVEPQHHQVLGIDFTYQMLPLARDKAGKSFFSIDLERSRQISTNRNARVPFLNG